MEQVKQPLYSWKIWLALIAVLVVIYSMLASRNRLPGAGTHLSYSLITQEFAQRLKAIPHYELTCTIDKSLKRFDGTLRVQVPATYTQDSEVVFHLPPNYGRSQAGNREQNMAVQRVLLDTRPAQVRDEKALLWVAVPLSERGKDVSIEMAFSAQLPELQLPTTYVEAGLQQLLNSILFKGREEFYGIYSYANDTASFANWYPILAVFNEGEADTTIPGNQGDITHFEVANYKVSVTAPQEVVVVTSGSTISSATRDGYTTYEFVGAGLREFTMNASRLYRSAQKQVGETTVSSYYYPQDERAGRKALDIAAAALELFNRSFGPYPFRDLKVVEAPIGGSAGGMEYAGLVTIAQQFYSKADLSSIPLLKTLQLDSSLGSLDPRITEMLESQLEWVVAHEVAHQWWHGLVGNNEKEVPFVDESLTNYSTYHYMVNTYGKKYAQQIAFQQLHFVYQVHRLNGGADQPITRAVTAFSSPLSYGSQVYSKGALHYAALHSLLGEVHFFNILREYVRRHAFTIVGIKDFDAVLEDYLEAKGEHLLLQRAKGLRERWLYGSYGDADIGTFSIISAMEAFLGPDVFKGPEGVKRKLLLSLAEPLVMQVVGELGRASK